MKTANLFLTLICLILTGCTRPKSPVTPTEASAHPESSAEPTPASESFPYPLYSSEHYHSEPLRIMHGEKTITGISFIPEETATTLIILSHGIGTNLWSTLPAAVKLAEAGYETVIFDFCGGSNDSASSGSMDEMSIRTEQEDLDTVVQYMKQNTSCEHLYLLGLSQGGVVSAMEARNMQSELDGLVLWFPAFNMQSLIKEKYGTPPVLNGPLTLYDQILSPKYFTDAMAVDFDEMMSDTPIPVLLLHGEADTVVPPAFSIQAAKRYPDAEITLIKNAEHGFFLEDLEEACALTVQFIEACDDLNET